MIHEILTVFWKESRTNKKYTDKIALGLFAILIGCGIPLIIGKAWFETLFPIYFWMILSIIMVMTGVADLFAGERERHTLETLLSEYISEKSIALGKMMFILVMSWGFIGLCIILSGLTVNLFYYKTGWIFPFQLLYSAGLSFTTAFLFTIIGTWFSMFCATVIKAQRWVSVSFILFLFLSMFAVPERLSHWHKERVEWVVQFMQLPDWQYYLIWIGFQLLIDLLLCVLSLCACDRIRLLRI